MRSIMNKRIFILFLGILHSLVNAYAQNAFERIAARGELWVGVYGEQRPLFFEEGSQGPKGIEAYLSQKLAQGLGVGLRYQDFPDLDAAVKGLNRGEVDIVFGKHLANLSDSLRVFYTEPYAILKIELLVNRINYAQSITTGTLAKAFTQGLFPISVPDIPSYRDSLERAFSFLRPQYLQDQEAVWDHLEDGIGALLDEVSVAERLSNTPALNLRYRVFPSGMRSPVVALVSWREDWFLEWVNVLIQGQGEPADLGRLIEIDQLMSAVPTE
jgi:hypothetical protein